VAPQDCSQASMNRSHVGQLGRLWAGRRRSSVHQAIDDERDMKRSREERDPPRPLLRETGAHAGLQRRRAQSGCSSSLPCGTAWSPAETLAPQSGQQRGLGPPRGSCQRAFNNSIWPAGRLRRQTRPRIGVEVADFIAERFRIEPGHWSAAVDAIAARNFYGRASLLHSRPSRRWRSARVPR
jgi:hypothetical protein